MPVPGENAIITSNIYTEYLNIADIYFSLEKYDKAQEYYTLCLGSRSLYWTAYYKSAKTYALQGNWTSAEKMYQNLYKRDPENESVKASLAYIYSQNDYTLKAEEMYEELYKNHPENPEYLENYISILIINNKISEAKEKTEELKQNFPDKESIKKFQSKFDELENAETKDSETDKQTSKEK